MKTTPKGGLLLLLAAMILVLAVYLGGGSIFAPGSPAIGGGKMRTKWAREPVPENPLDKSAPGELKTATFALG